MGHPDIEGKREAGYSAPLGFLKMTSARLMQSENFRRLLLDSFFGRDDAIVGSDPFVGHVSCGAGAAPSLRADHLNVRPGLSSCSHFTALIAYYREQQATRQQSPRPSSG